jgi:hypothetical protein
MTSIEAKEVERLAVSAELARPLIHECNNFLNNLFLHVAILVAELPDESRMDWANVKSEGKALVSLLQQWQAFRSYSTPARGKMEFNQLVFEAVQDVSSDCGSIQLTVTPAREPLWMSGLLGSTKRLCMLILQYAVAAIQDAHNADLGISVRTAKRNGNVILEITGTGPVPATFDWKNFGDNGCGEPRSHGLIEAACCSLAERVGANIRVGRANHESGALIVELPASMEVDQR